ncbi:hypothetical protein GT347_02725 [Xylophilus rhododendri]|uniref:Uncharacterized protein n=1 Tax=Xylophilus rhododendri TaxID=2697032 RepID=A0A857IZH2_9BURK|nr:hypothetical protein [Xylophilus rhododendri]QHI96994.1 hypothetical protein GT347_02725 [Xylophilus rhododendri]
MFPKAQTHAALSDVSHGKAIPAEYLEYFIGRGFVEAVRPGTDEAVNHDSPGAEIRLTDAGKACMRADGV